MLQDVSQHWNSNKFCKGRFLCPAENGNDLFCSSPWGCSKYSKYLSSLLVWVLCECDRPFVVQDWASRFCDLQGPACDCDRRERPDEQRATSIFLTSVTLVLLLPEKSDSYGETYPNENSDHRQNPACLVLTPPLFLCLTNKSQTGNLWDSSFSAGAIHRQWSPCAGKRWTTRYYTAVGSWIRPRALWVWI